MATKKIDNDKSEQTGGGWTLPLLLVVVLTALIVVMKLFPVEQALVSQTSGASSGKSGVAWTPSTAPVGETVSLTIDFGNGAKKEFATLPWRDGMTVADLLAVARDYRPGIEFSQTGAGATGFLTSLDGLAGQGVEGKNWLFQVDNRHILVSFCLEKLRPGMDVLWTFADEQYNAGAVEE